VPRRTGLSVRLKLTLSYAGFLALAGVLLLGAVWLFLLRYVPERAFIVPGSTGTNLTVFPVRSRLLHVFAPRAALVMACLLVLGLVGGWFLAGRILAPLTQITDATRRASNGSLSHRIQMTGPRDEFRELADAFDSMLAALQAQVEEQRRFAANASHELRTPLATVRAMLDVARRDPHRDVDEVLGRLQAVNNRAIDLTEALLQLSRVNHGSFTFEDIDLSLVAEEACESLAPLAARRGVTMELGTDPAPTNGQPALVSQLVTNLVHNALVHNLPQGGRTWVTTRTVGAVVELVVENTGEVIDPTVVETLTEAFQRGDQRIHTDHAGVGLGLAIANSIIKAHDGNLALTPLKNGGLRVLVQLPTSHSDTPSSSPIGR
jgi:two-component system, OmpR family, sensor histidine kinase VanS